MGPNVKYDLKETFFLEQKEQQLRKRIYVDNIKILGTASRLIITPCAYTVGYHVYNGSRLVALHYL